MKENGVSPVVGVMLLLTVTIILAAVITATSGAFFSSGTTGSVRAGIVWSGDDGEDFIFEMTNGEAFSLEDIRLVYTVMDKTDTREEKGFTAGYVSLDHSRFKAPKPSFETAPDDRIIYAFFDRKTGTLISAGELP